MSGTNDTPEDMPVRLSIPIDLPAGYPVEYHVMLRLHAREAMERFVQKSRDYDPSVFKFLGEKGQFSDMTRKFLKLKSVLWDNKVELHEEGLVEIIDDLIGHCLIMRYILGELEDES